MTTAATASSEANSLIKAMIGGNLLDVVPFEPPVRIHNSKDHCNQLRDQQNMDFALPSIRCSAGWHDYEPLYTVKMDVIGFEEDPHQLRMRWKCTRCGEEITLPAGVFPEKA